MKIEVSLGEILDRQSILKIKILKVSDPGKILNVDREYQGILKSLKGLKLDNLQEQIEQLNKVNKELWDIEDKLRIKEVEQIFDQEFINLARSVYKLNDKRYNIKREINLLSGSSIVEEKQYPKYKDMP
jgi:hypothetical protein